MTNEKARFRFDFDAFFAKQYGGVRIPGLLRDMWEDRRRAVKRPIVAEGFTVTTMSIVRNEHSLESRLRFSRRAVEKEIRMRLQYRGRAIKAGAACVALVLAVILSPGASADLITNGNFAAPGVAGGFNIYSSIPGWTASADGIEIDNSTILGLTCHDADCQSMEVNGNTFDTITQSVTGLAIGNTYMLSWAYGDRPGSGLQRLNVYFGNTLITADQGTGSGAWSNNAFTITATATTENLVFQAMNVGGSPSVGNEVDDVSLVQTAPVPEPASLTVLATALVGLGWARVQRTKKAPDRFQSGAFLSAKA
jgi:hypothetical protein